MSSLVLFDDQTEIVDKLHKEMETERNILVQSPTGSGKTAMASYVIMKAYAKGARTLFSVPRRDLLEQTSKTFTKLGIPHSFIAAGRDFNPFAQIFIGMVETMARRVDKLPNFHLSMYDETHYGDGALNTVITQTKTPWRDSNNNLIKPWNIGWSATPWKLNGKGMGMWYNKMIHGKSIKWLIENKRLSDYKFYYGRTVLELEKLKTAGGDYAPGELADFMEHQKAVIGDCVNDYKLRCLGKLHIVRCASIKHSQMVAESFRESGVPAAHVDGNTPDAIKFGIFMAFARREIHVLTFADLLNFGFDLSQATGMDVCIESQSDLKPSMSLAGQMQFWGRALRYKPYPAVINDHVNNYTRHQLPCSPREWSLLGKPKTEGEKIPASKMCPRCFMVHSPAPKCPECGWVYEIIGREIDEVDGELHEMDKDAFNKRTFGEQHEPVKGGFEGVLPFTEEERTMDYLIRLAKRDKKKNPIKWASEELKRRSQTA